MESPGRIDEGVRDRIIEETAPPSLDGMAPEMLVRRMRNAR